MFGIITGFYNQLGNFIIMSRIKQTFEKLKQQNRKALVGFLMAGDPDFDISEAHCRTALQNGVDVLELGVPFSDPTADGPVIQAAGRRGLAAGTTIDGVLKLAGRLRKDFDTPIVIFGYANPFFNYGYARLAKEASEAGVDAFLVVDLPFEESDEFKTHLDKQGLDFVSLIAPTTPSARLAVILKNARGFVYYIMVKGVTGVRTEIPADVAAHLGRLRQNTTLPIVAGFGVSDGAQAKSAARYADGVVVGSALIQAAGEGRLAALVKELRQALDIH
jgi:tryptophan synthase alpha chain